MKKHPVVLIYKSLTCIVAPYMTEPENIQEKCSCYERPGDAFDFQGYRIINSYRQSVIHCPQCQSFFVSAPDILGVENPKKPATSQKFGMWSSVSAVINVNDLSVVLLAPPGVVKKLPVAFLDKVNVVTAPPVSIWIIFLIRTSGTHLFISGSSGVKHMN